MKIAQVIPLTRLKRSLNYFDYSIPKDLQSKIKRGQLVEIPFKKSKIKGVIFSLEKSSKIQKLKSIEGIIETKPLLKSWQLKLIKYVCENNFVSISILAKMLVPEIPKRVIKSKYQAFQDFYFVKTTVSPLLFDNKLDQIYADISKNKPVLLRYYNYENKIKVYLKLIKTAIKNNKQLAVIFPRLIDLQKFYQYMEKYQDNTSLFLNDMPKGLFYQQWQKINKGEVNIILGTRSAIFAPFKNLDLLIIDQEDDPNHYQEEPNPRYNVKNIALFLNQILKCKLFYISQSPSLNSLYQVQQKNWKYFEIDKIKSLPDIKIIDRNIELRKGNFSIISDDLFQELEYNIKRGKKSFLFLNRKGSATMAMCQDCNYIAKCNTCKLPVTVHQNKKLACHHCHKEYDLILSCPKCKGANIKLTGAGTEKLEADIRDKFPGAKVLKLDQDTPMASQDINIYDIIIGTSYAFDYVDWQNIDLAGIMNADTLLYLPDYRSQEKTFNQLIKIASYLNAVKESKLFIQTFIPENYIFESIKKLDYKSFYINEIKQRKELSYPPYSKLIRLIYQSYEFMAGQREIDDIYLNLKNKKLPNTIINPPQLAYTQQLHGRWRWQVILRVKDKNMDMKFLSQLPDNVIIDVNPESLI